MGGNCGNTGRNVKTNFIIMGSGGTSNVDVYLTGGTYSSGDATLRLVRNDNITIAITGITGGAEFTGNTSASCISDIYVSNIYACSPLTLHSGERIGNSIAGQPKLDITATEIEIGGNAYSLPYTAGTEGQVLAFPSSGTRLEWVDQSSGGTGGITANTYVTGGTLVGGILGLGRNDGVDIIVTGFSDSNTYVTGGTLVGGNLLLSRNDNIDIPITGFGAFSADTYLTGASYINNILTLTRNDGVSLIATGITDYYVTGGTLNSSILTLGRNDGTSLNITGFTDSDTYITGGTYSSSASTLSLFRNDATTINIPWVDVYVTGATFNSSNNILSLFRNDGSEISANTSTQVLEEITLACSPIGGELSTGSTVAYIRMPFGMELSEVRASVLTASTGSDIITIDVKNPSDSIFSGGTYLTIDSSGTTSVTATTSPIITGSTLIDDSLVIVDLRRVGDVYGGSSLNVTLKGYRI